MSLHIEDNVLSSLFSYFSRQIPFLVSRAYPKYSYNLPGLRQSVEFPHSVHPPPLLIHHAHP